MEKKVEGRPNLLRTSTGAIVNKNYAGLEAARKRKAKDSAVRLLTSRVDELEDQVKMLLEAQKEDK